MRAQENAIMLHLRMSGHNPELRGLLFGPNVDRELGLLIWSWDGQNYFMLWDGPAARKIERAVQEIVPEFTLAKLMEVDHGPG
jgi:hypothetical protein